MYDSPLTSSTEIFSPLLFGMDYDETFTAAPALWKVFIEAAREAGHQVICVTARRDTRKNHRELGDHFAKYGLGMTVYYSNLKSKIKLMQKLGITVDIWMDNDPFTLIHGH